MNFKLNQLFDSVLGVGLLLISGSFGFEGWWPPAETLGHLIFAYLDDVSFAEKSSVSAEFVDGASWQSTGGSKFHTFYDNGESLIWKVWSAVLLRRGTLQRNLP